MILNRFNRIAARTPGDAGLRSAMERGASSSRARPKSALTARLGAAAAFLLCLLAVLAHRAAADAPLSACEAAPYPPYPMVGSPPDVRLWTDAAAPPDWLPPTCPEWAAEDFKLVVALAGIFEDDGDVEDMLARFGAVSSTRGVKYWSVTDRAWRVLIKDAFALSAADLTQRRADFTATELATGDELFFAEQDNRSSNLTVYRLRAAVLAPERATIVVENVTAVRLWGITLFGPGHLKSIYQLERLSPDVWGYSSLGGVAKGASFLSNGHHSSYINRAVALYRHVAGIPTDREPPAAP